jgi:hypothetical protein
MPVAVILVRKISSFLNAGTRSGKEIVMQSRLITPGLVVVILWFLLAGISSVPAQAREPWKFLEDFALVPGAVSRVEGGYVAAVFHNSEKGLFALIIYPGVCGSQSCDVTDPDAILWLIPRSSRQVPPRTGHGAFVANCRFSER